MIEAFFQNHRLIRYEKMPCDPLTPYIPANIAKGFPSTTNFRHECLQNESTGRIQLIIILLLLGGDGAAGLLDYLNFSSRFIRAFLKLVLRAVAARCVYITTFEGRNLVHRFFKNFSSLDNTNCSLRTNSSMF